MVTNQDGLGTDAFPEEHFWPVQKKIVQAFENEGVVFDDVVIDTTLPEEESASRKPGTALLQQYKEGDYDLENSFVIGNEESDLELANNLGANGILLSDESHLDAVLCSTHWPDIVRFLALRERGAVVQRTTKETDVKITLVLDGAGETNISTGLGFFDHMLEQLGKHSGCDLEVRVKGDLHIDEHHTVEDTALALGEAFRKALGDKRGISRYGYCLPMDDAQALVSIDFSGRPWLVWNAEFKREKVGDLPTELFSHFFKSFSDAAACNLNISVSGDNEHHKIEATFKAFARAIKTAIQKSLDDNSLPSTKGVL
jgi:imidazoleglycerol-phosphate dehydratase/histidinol-phosphatase